MALRRKNRSATSSISVGSIKRRQLLGGMAGASVGLWAASNASIKSAFAQSQEELPASIVEAAKALRDGRYSSEELTLAYLQAIEKLNPRLNAFTLVTREQALADARRLDRELQSGHDRGWLHGIPIGHKDLFDTKGIATTMGSEFFKDRIPTADATLVRRLAEAGAISLGKTNMNEFAAGVSGTNAYFGDAHNPWDVRRSPGGSSGGTGAAVAAGMCLAGTASDTGGSIRVPASWNGIAGIRPTFGRVSLSGAYPRAYSLDCAGPIGATVADIAIMLEAMAGYDESYAHSVKTSPEVFTDALGKGLQGLKIGIIENYTYRDVDTDVAEAVEQATDTLTQAGAELVSVKIPMLGGALEYSSLFNILLYEFNQILGPSYRNEPNKDLFGPIVQDNIAKGEKISKEFYRRALDMRAQQKAEFRHVFDSVDALITPTMPTTAPLLDASGDTYDRGRQFMLPFSWTGVPSVSVPCGFDRNGMPIGVQFIADEMQESLLLQIASVYERETEFHKMKPEVHAERT